MYVGTSTRVSAHSGSTISGSSLPYGHPLDPFDIPTFCCCPTIELNPTSPHALPAAPNHRLFTGRMKFKAEDHGMVAFGDAMKLSNHANITDVGKRLDRYLANI